MNRIVKRTLSAGLVAILRPASGLIENLTRIWSFARLVSRLRSRLDPSVVVLGTPELQGTRDIKCGRDLLLYRDLYLETQEHGSIDIGDGVVISRGTHIVSFYGIHIGDGAMIGEYVSIRDANHIYGGETIRSAGHSGSAISVGCNAWIGRGAAILAGVTIGDNAVVAANAVVTRDVPANTVVAGVPARPMIKERVA
jgi:acetyltransferase-like isoleucine patch superfamily enzyme